MLTTDFTATYDDFEPYHEQTVTLPYDLYGIKVTSGGNVAINGQQYASDYFDAERGKIVRMVKKYVFTGDEDINKSSIVLNYALILLLKAICHGLILRKKNLFKIRRGEVKPILDLELKRKD